MAKQLTPAQREALEWLRDNGEDGYTMWGMQIFARPQCGSVSTINALERARAC